MTRTKTIIAFPDDYIVIDTETTGLDCKYDSLIEICGIKYRNNEEVERFERLVKPEKYYIADDEDDIENYVEVNGKYVSYVDAFITSLTGITNEMLVDAGTMEEVIPKFIEFIGNDILVGHNIGFDARFINKCICTLDGEFKNQMVDTMRISRKLLPELQHHRLKDLVKYFNISGKKAHRAEVDCEYTQQCYIELKKLLIDNYGSLDNYLETIKKKSRSHTLHVGDFTTENTIFNEDGDIYNKTFVFTGTLEKMTRKEAMQTVVDLGGHVGTSITSNTNFLVLGNNDYNPILRGAKSAKLKKAEKMKLDGEPIDIVSENVFYQMVEESIIEDSIEENEMYDWKKNIEEMLEHIIEDLELPERSLYLNENYKRGNGEVNSYSICIYEPEYPPAPNSSREPSRNSIIMNIKEDGKQLEIIIGLTEYEDLEKEKHTTKILKSESQKIHVYFDYDSNSLMEFVDRHVRYSVANYTSKASSFGCCSRFRACSDAKKCVHENKLYSKACMYRIHLDAGEIFYGKNKNIKE